MRKRNVSILALSLAVFGAATSASAITFIANNTNITTDTTWCDGTNTGPIVLQGAVFVTSNAALTILPGCVIRGDGRTGPASSGTTDVPGSLIITRDATLIADGTADQPIVFTTSAMDQNNDGIPDRGNDGGGTPRILPYVNGNTFYDQINPPLAPLAADGAGNHLLWGGIIILGSAPTNLADDCDVRTATPNDINYGDCFVEGLQIPGFTLANAVYGGNEPHDFSGIIRHVSIRHGGDEIGLGNEVNGLTLAGVGDGTVIENVEIYNNFDDGIEWFGGTVNGRNLVVSFAQDDQVDVDQGYTGVNQNVFVMMNWFNSPVWAGAGLPASLHGDKMGELDGVDFGATLGFNVNVRIQTASCTACSPGDERPWPFPNAAFWNLTGIGSQIPDAAQTATGVAATSANDAIVMRHGFAGLLANSIVIYTDASSGADRSPVDVANGSESAPTGFQSEDNAANDLIRIVASSWDAAALAGPEATAHTNGNTAVDNAEYGLVSATVSDHYNDQTVAATSLLVDPSCSFAPGGTGTPGRLVLGGSACDPHTLTADPGVIPSDTGLDRSATYRGAFPAGLPLWTDGWTALDQGGLF